MTHFQMRLIELYESYPIEARYAPRKRKPRRDGPKSKAHESLAITRWWKQRWQAANRLERALNG